MNNKYSEWIQHAINILICIVLLFVYCKPIALDNQVLMQSDIVSHKGMSKELADYREKNGKEALWTDAMFGGMPAYQISTIYNGNLFSKVDEYISLGFPNPIRQLFILFLGFYFLLSTCKVNPWLSLLGGLAFMFSSYFFVILEAGHNSKAMAAAYMAPVIAGVLMTYRGRIWLGGAITLLGMVLELNANHIQVTYYMGMVVIAIAIAAFFEAQQKKDIPSFVKASGVLLVAAVLAVLPNTSRLWTTYEYTDYTMRGKSELSTADSKGGGLDREYALRWSYGPTETFTFLVPNLYGGASNSDIGENSEFYKKFSANPEARKSIEQAFRMPLEQAVKRMPTYWGDQPFTSGPVYIGAIIVFLYILSFLFVKTPYKWAIAAVTALTIMLSWGRHFPVLTDIFFDFVPMYNKFRAVSMILIVAEFTFPFMGILALSELVNQKAEAEKLKNKVWAEGAWQSVMIAGGISLGILALIFLLSQGFTFTVKGEDAQMAELLRADRMSMLSGDLGRAFFLIGAAIALLWAFIHDRIKNNLVLYLALIALVTIDMYSVDRRYLNEDSFVPESEYQGKVATLTPADEFILKDKSHHRVFKLGDPFNDAHTSYFHKSVGGYHPAKFRRYQDMIESNIGPEVQNLTTIMQKTPTDSAMRAALAASTVLNMMNTKYVIYNPSAQPLVNSAACGNAWFVSEIKEVKNADEELAALKGLNPMKTAIIDATFKGEVGGNAFATDSSAKIKLTEYQPNNIKYDSDNSKEGIAIFSEIYYAKGWVATIDGKEVPHFRADYVLRGLKIPAGKHKIEFNFAPKSYTQGETYSLIASVVALLLIAFGIFMDFKGRKEEVK
jgi:hypothetical protein